MHRGHDIDGSAVDGRVADLEDALARLPKFRTHAPAFWSDVEVRRLAIASHNERTLDRTLALIGALYGSDRTPSRAALGRFNLLIDRARAAK